MEEKLLKKYGKTDPKIIGLICDMLQFNPHFRPSAKECLKRSLFDKVRTKSNEKTAVHKINIDVDRD